MRRTLYKGKDPRNLPTYVLADAAHHLSLSPSTLRSWTRKARRAPPLIILAQDQPPTLSFWNLVEAQVLAAIRKKHQISLQKIRKALQYVEKELKTPRPLIKQVFMTDGVSLFVDSYGELIDASEQGQLAIRELIIAGLERIEHDEQGLAKKLFLWSKSPEDPKLVSVDPRRSFGRPVIEGTSVPVDILADRWQAGDSIAQLARDFHLKPSQIEGVLRWERSAAA